MSYRDAKLARDLRRRQLEEELAELATPDADDAARLADARRRRIAWWSSIGINIWILMLVVWRLGFEPRGAEAAERQSATLLRQAAEIHIDAIVSKHYVFGRATPTTAPNLMCPTVSDLEAAQLIFAGVFHEDAWGTPYRIACSYDERGFGVTVLSAGPDRIHGSEDDIVR